MRSLLVPILFFSCSLLALPCRGVDGTKPQPPAPTHRLHFPNGDRLTGTVVRQDDEVIVFRSLTLGEMTVPRSAARLSRGGEDFEVPVEALVGLVDPPPDKPAKAVAPPPDAAPAAAKPPPDTTAERIAAALDEPTRDSWDGKLEFGLRQQQGRRDIFSVDIRGSAERSIKEHNLRATARLLYGEQDGNVNNDRYDASFQWRREIGQRTFAQSLTSYFQDDLKDISRNWEQNLGAGFRVFDGEDHVVNLGAGLTGQYREATFSPSGFYGLVEIFQDYTFRISPRLSIRQNAQAQYSPDGGTKFLSLTTQPSASVQESTNYKVRFNTVFQGKLTQQLSMNLRFEFEYDNAVRPSTARTDQRIISSLGYAF